jgi:hypothetical protein
VVEQFRQQVAGRHTQRRRDAEAFVDGGGEGTQGVAQLIDQILFQALRLAAQELAHLVERCQVGNVDHGQRGIAAGSDQCCPFHGMAGRARQVGGRQDVFEFSHVQAPVVSLRGAPLLRVAAEEMLGHPLGQFLFAKNTVPNLSLRSNSDSASLWVRSRISMSGFKVRGFDHLADIDRVGQGDDQGVGIGDMRLDQHRGSAASPDTEDAAFAQALDQLAILFGHDEGISRLLRASAMRCPTRP